MKHADPDYQPTGTTASEAHQWAVRLKLSRIERCLYTIRLSLTVAIFLLAMIVVVLVTLR